MRKFILYLITPRLVLIFMFGLFFSTTASAAIYSYIKETTGDNISATYYYVIDRWDEEDPNARNPCYGAKKCNLQLNHRHYASGGGGLVTKVIIADITKYETMAEIREEAMRVFSIPYEGRITHIAEHGEPPVQECVGLFYGTQIQNNYDANARLLPGSICGIAPPPVGACKVLEDSLLIDYKELYANELDDASRSVDVNITCNLDVEVNVYAAGADADEVVLRSDKSLLANLYLNDQPAPKGIAVTVTKNDKATISLKSILKTNGKVEPGAFSGSGYLILTLP